MAEPRCQMQGHVPDLVLAPYDALISTVPNELDDERHGPVMPCPSCTVQRRFQGRVLGRKQDVVPATGVEFLD